MKADQNKLLPKKESRKEQRLWSRLLGQIKVKTDKLTTVRGRDTAACTHRADWTHVKPGRKSKAIRRRRSSERVVSLWIQIECTIDHMTDGSRQESLWVVIFANNVVICSESKWKRA